MPDPERPRVRSDYFYGVILQSALERDTTAQMWERIRGAAEASGLDIGADAFTRVNELRSNAVSVANAARNLARAREADAITSDMLGRPIYARPLQAFEALPQYEARIRIQMQTPGGVADQWVRVVFGADRPDTVGGLLDELELFAQDMAPGYGGELLGWDNLVLNEV